MFQNPFNPKNQGENHPPRNSFDLSRNSVFTSDFFKLYPHFIQEVIPGDSFEIDASVGFRAMPTCFPVQTRVRVSQEFYYVRNRTLTDVWEDGVFKIKDVELPWLRISVANAKRQIGVNSLSDAFGVPTTIGKVGELGNFTLSFENLSPRVARLSLLPVPNSDPSFFLGGNITVDSPLTTYSASAYYCACLSSLFSSRVTISTKFCLPISEISSPQSLPINFCLYVCKPDGTMLDGGFYKDGNYYYLVNPLIFHLTPNSDNDTYVSTVSFGQVFSDFVNKKIDEFGSVRFCFLYQSYNSAGSFNFVSQLSMPNNSEAKYNMAVFSRAFLTDTIFTSIQADDFESSVFVGSNPKIRLSALPFRAYEMCCNYYYRNDKNNPYMLNGEPQYNEFIPTHDGGPDDNVYDFHYRNWELDQYTSAQQSPQFGEAPLVGVIYSPTKPTATLHFDGSIGDGETATYDVTVGLDDDKIASIVDFSKDTPSAALQRLQREINAGISINDLRITNSFQRFLENVMRRGLRYRNQLKSHFGVSVDYPDIDVPQYIGGASAFLDSGQVTNMADSPNAGLGDYVGTLQGGVRSSNKIRCYCPEHGFIIGIVSITPIPSYSQSISKFLIKKDPFDYYNTEFGKIGFVPIHYSELSPLQTPDGGSVDDVFGYQKAWYDYMNAVDEVHGDFRTTLANFVLSRTFANRPQLSESFTVGHPEQLNDIFVTNNIADAYGSNAKFLCSAQFIVNALRPIPIVGTPSLE